MKLMAKKEVTCKACGMKFEGKTEEEAKKKLMEHNKKAHPM
jgi:predicted small metal-binding protein